MEQIVIKKAVQVRTREGVVVSDKMQKTRVVEVSITKRHPKYLKQYIAHSRFKAHDEKNEYKEGDKVVIQATRPMSKEKRWVIVAKV
jgi:small subunit ribosomal protein S17